MVEYFHIFGERKVLDTIEQVVARPIVKKPISILRTDLRLQTKFGLGDKTVPRLSAERIWNAENFNFGDATLFALESDGQVEDARYEHLGLVKAQEVKDKVLAYLGLISQPSVFSLGNQNGEKKMPSYEYKASSGLSLKKLAKPKAEGYYITIEGVDRLEITDDEGNTNTPIGDDGFELAVPNVGYSGGIYDEAVNIGYHGLTMPAEYGEFTVKFRTGTDSIDIEVLRGIGNTSPILAIRYIDLDVPANVECLLTFSPAGVPDLRYDADGDGEYETVVSAHVRVTGKDAQDTMAPIVNVEYSRRTGQGRLITINAVDGESGVGTVYYRVGETGNYQIYTGTFHLHVPFARTVEAFADDNVGNRSSPVKITVPAWNTLP